MDELDPLHKVELALLRAEHQKRYQTMITYLKEQIGVGIEYHNAVARAVVSETGAFYELNDLPEEFSGAVGPEVSHRFVTTEEASGLLQRAFEAISLITRDNTRHVSLLILYTRRGIVDRKNCYVYDCRVDENTFTPAPITIGRYRPETMPLFFKIKIDADFAPEILNMSRGVVICLANTGDRHLLIRIPYEGEEVFDLNNLPSTDTIH